MILVLFRKATESFSNSQLNRHIFIYFCKNKAVNAHKIGLFLHNVTLFVQIDASFS
jgi:hypothetical protein